MFGDNTDYTLQEWINSRDLYLIASRSEELPDHLREIYHNRAIIAANKVIEIEQEIADLDFAMSLPAYENECFKIRTKP